ncbi:MAG TPA: MFS transporter [Puia sp.]|jgi:MFS family permease
MNNKKMKKLPVFRAFQSRNYRLYFYGQSVSLIGTWMQRTAVSWVVYTLTQSTFMLGLSLFATQFPSFLLSTLGGVVSDRYYRYRVLLITQIASLVQSILMAALILSGHYNVWMILGLGVVLGSINAFDVPARQALVYEMIDDKENLPNALALNSSMVNLARLIGPAIAGIVLHKLGEGICFIVNSVSFLAVIGSLLRMKLPPYVKTIRDKNAFGELREGWSYLMKNPTIARPILMLAAMSLLVIPYATLLPVYAREIFHGNAATFGLIDSFIGMGAICGALYLATRKGGGTVASRKKILRTNTLIFAVGLICFSHMTSFPIAMVFAVIAGFGMMAQTTVTNTIIQMTVAPEMRGRVISYFAMSYFGMMPIGSLLVGTVSQYVGAPNTVLFEGIAALVVVAIFWSSYLSVKEAPVKAAKPTAKAADEVIKATATAAPAQPAPTPAHPTAAI